MIHLVNMVVAIVETHSTVLFKLFPNILTMLHKIFLALQEWIIA